MTEEELVTRKRYAFTGSSDLAACGRSAEKLIRNPWKNNT
jgi:hypothetical protein